METPLSHTSVETFRRDGYLLLKNMVPTTVRARMSEITQAHLQQEITPLEYEAELGYPGAPSSLDSVGGRTIRRLRAAWQRDPIFRTWACNPTLLSFLKQLFGEPVCITLAHHNCIMTKHPHFGTATGWHRDIRYWSFEHNNLISVWLALEEENATNGGLKFIPGSQSMTLQPHQMDELDFLRPENPANQALFEQGIHVPLAGGDVLLFHSGLFHAAGRNNSSQLKSSVVFAYHGQSNHPLPSSRSAASDDILLD